MNKLDEKTALMEMVRHAEQKNLDYCYDFNADEYELDKIWEYKR